MHREVAFMTKYEIKLVPVFPRFSQGFAYNNIVISN